MLRIEALDHLPLPVIAIGNDYPDGHAIPTHSHRRGQLLSGATGVTVLTTASGTWVMPPQRGMWIPPGTRHSVRMIGAVQMQSLYLDPALAQSMPGDCRVLAISPFMRALLAEALSLPHAAELDERGAALLALVPHELRRLPELPLSLPLPAHPRLAERCRQFLRAPNAHDTIADWHDAAAMSRRSFTRLFRAQTGMSLAAWRQQACLLAALPRLAAGETVTAVALDLGYDNPASFTAMCHRLLGAPPRDILRAEAPPRLQQGRKPAHLALHNERPAP